MIIDELMGHFPALAGMVFLLACSAFFSGSETALFSLTRADIRHFEGALDWRGKYVVSLLRSPHSLLSAILLGNMVVNVSFYMLSFVITLGLAERVSGGAAAVSGVVSLFAVIMVGEVSPKGIAVGRPVSFSRLVAPVLYWYCKAVHPLSLALRLVAQRVSGFLAARLPRAPYVTGEELQMLAAMAEQQGVMDVETRGMVQQVVGLSTIRVREVMTPRVDVPMFNLADGRAAFCARVRQSHEDRVLAYEGTMDNVLGLLLSREVFVRAEADLRELLRPLRYVPETQRVESLLRQFRKGRHAVAIVVDEFGGTAGLVDLEQILEEVVGEIRDEFEPEVQMVERLGEDRYVLAGDLNMREWQELLGAELVRPGVETLGGLVAALLGRIPEAGDSVNWRGLWFTVEKMDGRRVEFVRVERLAEEGHAG